MKRAINFLRVSIDILVVFLILLFFIFSYSNESYAIEWANTYGGVGQDEAASIQQTADGGYILAGTTNSFGLGNYDFWVLKLDSSGNIQWQKTYGGTGYDWALAIQQTADGGYIVEGDTFSFGEIGASDIWILKLDSSGNIQWQKTYNGQAVSLQQTDDGGYIMAGAIDPFGSGAYDFWVLKLDSGGSIQWQKTYGGLGDDGANSVQQTTDSGYIVGGYTCAGNCDFWILKLDNGGNIQWQKTYGGPSSDYLTSIQQTTDNGYIVTGDTHSFGSGDADFLILKLDVSGNILWQKTYGGPNGELPYLINQTSDNGYIVAGTLIPIGVGPDILVVKLDSKGDINGCTYIGTSYAIENDTNATGIDTNVTAVDRNNSSAITSITGVDTNATEALACTAAPADITLSGNGSDSINNTSQIYLSWVTSSGITGIDHYEIYDSNNNLLAATTNKSYLLTGNYSFSYYVKAVDGGGNQLALSNVLQTYIPPCFYEPFFADFEPNNDEATSVTGAPRNLVPSPHFYGHIINSTDEDWYRFYVYEGQTIEQIISVQSTGTQIGWLVKSPGGTILHQMTNLGTSVSSDQFSYVAPSGGEGYYFMRIWNVNGNNVSTRYEHDIKVTPQIDTNFPSPVTNLQAISVSDTEVDLSWTPCTDDKGPIFYGVLNGNTCFFVVATTASSYTVRNLTPNTTYWLYVGAGDAAFNISFPAGVQVTTLQASPVDTTPPTTPGSLHWDSITTTSVTLAWNLASDNVEVVGYRIYDASNALIATTINTSYEVTGLTPGASYSFFVRAYDAAGNQSSASNICGGTLPNSISTEPAPPGNDVEVPLQVDLPSGGTTTVTVEFSQISSGGTLEIAAVPNPPAPPPTGFRLLDTVYYINAETITYISPVFVTIHYDEPQIPGFDETNLRMFHWENGAWKDVTVEGSIDTVNNTITGQVDVLSPFVIGYPFFSGGSGYSTGANENMIALIAILAISGGLFILRRQQRIKA